MDQSSTALFQFIRLPTDNQCQILETITDAEQLFALYKADERGDIHGLIQNCVKEIEYVIQPGSVNVVEIFAFISLLRGLRKIVIRGYLELNGRAIPATILANCYEIAKLPHLRDIEIGFIDTTLVRAFLTNYCFGLIQRINNRGILSNVKLNRTLDNVQLRMHNLVLNDGIIYTNDNDLRTFVTDLFTRIKNIRLTEALKENYYYLNLLNSRDLLRTVEILDISSNIEMINILPGSKHYLVNQVNYILKRSPIRIITYEAAPEDVTELLMIIPENSIPKTLKEIQAPLDSRNWDKIKEIFNKFNRVEVFNIKFWSQEQLDQAHQFIPELLQEYKQIKMIELQLSTGSFGPLPEFPVDSYQTEFKAYPNVLHKQFSVLVQPKISVVWTD